MMSPSPAFLMSELPVEIKGQARFYASKFKEFFTDLMTLSDKLASLFISLEWFGFLRRVSNAEEGDDFSIEDPRGHRR